MRRTSMVLTVTCVLLLPWASGCSKFQARMHFKKANAHYRNENYKAAINEYETGLHLDPAAKAVWRSVGLAAMALHRPGDDSKENTQIAQTAVEAFQKYLMEYPQDQKVEEYLLTTLINLERFDDALKMLREQQLEHPGRKEEFEGMIVNTLIKAKRIDQAFARVNAAKPRPDPDRLYMIGVACWDKAYRDITISQEDRAKVVEMGMQALVRANEIRPNHFFTMVYINLLYREKAKLELDPFKARDLYDLAEEWLAKAKAQKVLDDQKLAKGASS